MQHELHFGHFTVHSCGILSQCLWLPLLQDYARHLRRNPSNNDPLASFLPDLQKPLIRCFSLWICLDSFCPWEHAVDGPLTGFLCGTQFKRLSLVVPSSLFTDKHSHCVTTTHCVSHLFGVYLLLVCFVGIMLQRRWVQEYANSRFQLFCISA